MILYIWVGNMMADAIDAEGLVDAMRKALDCHQANKFELVGNGLHLTGIPSFDCNTITWK